MGAETIYGDDPIIVAQKWEQEGAERLHLVDLDGAVTGRPVHDRLIEKITKTVSIPVQVGGGIRDRTSIERYLAAGVSWIIMGTSAVQNTPLLIEAVERYPQKIIAGIDARNGQVAMRGWTELSTEKVIDLAIRIEKVGVAAIIATDIACDGMLAGPNRILYKELAAAVKIPIIASGGITTLDHIRELADLADLAGFAGLAGVKGAIIGKALYEGRLSLSEAIASMRRPA